MELAEESADLHITDTENIIYDSVWFGDEAEYDEVTEADDIRLYNGAEISITGGGSLIFTTDNAQPFTQETAANPLTESFILEEGVSIAGENIRRGSMTLYSRKMTNTYRLDWSCYIRTNTANICGHQTAAESPKKGS